MAEVELADGKTLDDLFAEMFPDLDKDDIEKCSSDTRANVTSSKLSK